MLYFSAENLEELKNFLRTINIHDGCFRCATYDQTTKTFVTQIENAIWNESVGMMFINVFKFVSVSDFKWSNDETINCLVVIDSSQKIPEPINACDCTDKLCFVWEMFSGNRIFIVCSGLKILNNELETTPLF